MKISKKRIANKIISYIMAILIITVICAVSWAINAAFVWVIFFCFGIEFTFLKATGVWLILVLLLMVFKKQDRG